MEWCYRARRHPGRTQVAVKFMWDEVVKDDPPQRSLPEVLTSHSVLTGWDEAPRIAWHRHCRSIVDDNDFAFGDLSHIRIYQALVASGNGRRTRRKMDCIFGLA